MPTPRVGSDLQSKPWKASIEPNQDLLTLTKRSPVRVRELTDDHIVVEPKNGKRVRLLYSHLDALWRQWDYLNAEITKRRGIALNTIVNKAWKDGGLQTDHTNESYYWAVVCERKRRNGSLDSDYEAAEGNPILQRHLRRERDLTLVRRKRSAVLAATGRLACEACQFDFQKCFPGLGAGFCEVHHTRALAQGERITKLGDLAILCSNCHRMIHKTRPMESIEAFRNRFFPSAKMP